MEYSPAKTTLAGPEPKAKKEPAKQGRQGLHIWNIRVSLLRGKTVGVYLFTKISTYRLFSVTQITLSIQRATWKWSKVASGKSLTSEGRAILDYVSALYLYHSAHFWKTILHERFYDQLSYGLWLINASCCIQCSWPLCASLFKAPHCHYSLFLVTFCTLENTSRICFLSALTLVFHDARTPAAAVSGVRFSGTRGDS